MPSPKPTGEDDMSVKELLEILNYTHDMSYNPLKNLAHGDEMNRRRREKA